MVSVVSTRKTKAKAKTKPSIEDYKVVVNRNHVHCWHTVEVAHTKADRCCRCGEEIPVGAPVDKVGFTPPVVVS